MPFVAELTLLTTKNTKSYLEHREKSRKCWLTAFSPFSTMFSTLSKTEFISITTLVSCLQMLLNLVLSNFEVRHRDSLYQMTKFQIKFKAFADEMWLKHCGKEENASFSTML